MKKGKFIVVVGPMGTGKGTLIRYARETFPELVFPKTKTTRDRRPNDDKASVYDFISAEEFQRMIDNGEFAEWADTTGNGKRYGTPFAPIQEAIAAGKVIIKEADVQGVRQLRETFPKDELVVVFVHGGTWEDMIARGKARPGAEELSEEYLANRKVRFDDEMEFMSSADYIVDNRNDGLGEAKKELSRIIRSLL